MIAQTPALSKSSASQRIGVAYVDRLQNTSSHETAYREFRSWADLNIPQKENGQYRKNEIRSYGHSFFNQQIEVENYATVAN